MTNTESHKSVAIELPTYRVLKKVAEAEFRTPSKQIAFLLHRDYPEIFADIANGYDNEDPVTPTEVDGSDNVVEFKHDCCDVPRTQYRTWQVLLCLYKNRALGPLTTNQISRAINYTAQTNLASTLHSPRERGLVASRPIRENAREVEWLLTDFGVFVAKDLDDNIPVRLTETILANFERNFLRNAS